MDRYRGPRTALTIKLPGGLYIAIIMDRYKGPQTSLTIALPGGLYLGIIMDRYRGPQIALNIALPGGLKVATTMDRYRGTKIFPYYSLASRTIHNNYNGPLWRVQNCRYHSLVWTPLLRN
jgi:hypothetical protein